MKVSKAIEELQAIQASHGDIEILLDTDTDYGDGDGSFIPVMGFVTQDTYRVEEDDENVRNSKSVVLDFHESHKMDRD